MKQIKMFYIGVYVPRDEQKVNDFLKQMGDKVIDVQMESNIKTGGDTLDTVMVVYEG